MCELIDCEREEIIRELVEWHSKSLRSPFQHLNRLFKGATYRNRSHWAMQWLKEHGFTEYLESERRWVLTIKGYRFMEKVMEDEA